MVREVAAWRRYSRKEPAGARGANARRGVRITPLYLRPSVHRNAKMSRASVSLSSPHTPPRLTARGVEEVERYTFSGILLCCSFAALSGLGYGDLISGRSVPLQGVCLSEEFDLDRHRVGARCGYRAVYEFYGFVLRVKDVERERRHYGIGSGNYYREFVARDKLELEFRSASVRIVPVPLLERVGIHRGSGSAADDRFERELLSRNEFLALVPA